MRRSRELAGRRSLRCGPIRRTREKRPPGEQAVRCVRAARRPAASPFHRLADFLALPRVAALALSADGTRLAISVPTLDAEKKKWQSALWEVDPAGSGPPGG